MSVTEQSGVELSVAEDLALLLLNEQTGEFVAHHRLDGGMAAATLLDLAIRGRLELSGDEARIFVLDGETTGNLILNDALGEIASDEGSRPDDVLGVLAPGLFERVLTGLVDCGVIAREERTTFAVFSDTTWKVLDSVRLTELRAQLKDALVGYAVPQERVAAVISVLSAMHVITDVLEVPEQEQLIARAEEILEQTWAPETPAAIIAESNKVMLDGGLGETGFQVD